VSAVDEYRKFSYVVQFGGHILPEDIAVVREVFIKMESRADAAIAELEAENDQLQSFIIHDGEARPYSVKTLQEKLEQAEAEMAAVKGRRCETCEWWESHTYDADGTCRSTFKYTPEWTDDESEVRVSEFVAFYASSNEYYFNPPPDFACNRWTARAEEGGE